MNQVYSQVDIQVCNQVYHKARTKP
jgi:hypothetical protein